MTTRQLPALPVARPAGGVQFQVLPRAFERWHPGIMAAADDAADTDRTITVYDQIGRDFWGDGVTAKRVAGALRGMGKGPVTVAINSPGGDLFEGIAIFNLLREHPGDVTVKVLGLAASAASIIAMAGDTIQIARSAFYMVHNTWVIAAGNRNDLADIAEWLAPFDAAMADVYAARTGTELADVQKLMDAETWIGGSAAVEKGFADELLPADQVERGNADARAMATATSRRMESVLRAAGVSKSDAVRLISEFKSAAGDPGGSGAGDPAEQRARQREAFLLREMSAEADAIIHRLAG